MDAERGGRLCRETIDDATLAGPTLPVVPVSPGNLGPCRIESSGVSRSAAHRVFRASHSTLSEIPCGLLRKRDLSDVPQKFGSPEPSPRETPAPQKKTTLPLSTSFMRWTGILGPFDTSSGIEGSGALRLDCCLALRADPSNETKIIGLSSRSGLNERAEQEDTSYLNFRLGLCVTSYCWHSPWSTRW